jgi:hypothetical protein
LLQKSFWGGERKILEPLMRFTRGGGDSAHEVIVVDRVMRVTLGQIAP